MRTLVFIVGGLPSSGSCWVKSVNSGALCHAASERSPSMTGGALTRTACRTGCSGQFAACAAAAPSKVRTRNMPVRMDDAKDTTIRSPAMLCPGCKTAMQRLTLDAVLGGQVDIDVCTQCRAFWFEPFETLHLRPASTLKLFSLIAHPNAAATAFPTTSHCPQCGAQLRLTHDRQRNTPFTYWRCDAGHGRFTPFIDFLREKDFIKPLSPQQIAELRQSVQTIHCGNCGAAIDLAHDSTCGHCGAALSMLDLSKVTRLPAEPPPPPP